MSRKSNKQMRTELYGPYYNPHRTQKQVDRIRKALIGSKVGELKRDRSLREWERGMERADKDEQDEPQKVSQNKQFRR